MLGARAEAGIWRLDAGSVRPAAGTAARPILLIPTEQVLTMAVALPLPSHARRLAALPFAIEDRIADRADRMHLALGTQQSGGAWLAAVVDREAMAAWVAAAADAGLADAAIMPDALALPVPEPGRWNVRRESDGRIIVRTAEGTGFAAREPLFVPLWTAAGKPECDEVEEGGGSPIPIALDLRQGDFARPRQGLSKTGRRVVIVAIAGLVAHGAIAAADTVALRSVAAKRGSELTALLQTAAPGRYGGDDPHEAALVAAELLPAGGNAPPGTLLPLLSRASSALAPFGSAVMVKSMSFETGRSLRLEVELAEPAARGNIVNALRSAGLTGRFDGASLIIGGAA